MKWVSLGCWEDWWLSRAIQEKYEDYRKSANPISNCAEFTEGQGYSVFAVQHSGQCFTSSNAEHTYKQHGKATNCVGGEGGDWANNVYKIVKEETSTAATTFMTSSFSSETAPQEETTSATGDGRDSTSIVGYEQHSTSASSNAATLTQHSSSSTQPASPSLQTLEIVLPLVITLMVITALLIIVFYIRKKQMKKNLKHTGTSNVSYDNSTVENVYDTATGYENDGNTAQTDDDEKEDKINILYGQVQVEEDSNKSHVEVANVLYGSY